MEDAGAQVLHASCVAQAGRGCLILGPSGSGKSALALQLIALGAALVADDRVALELRDDRPFATRPPGLPPLIEARGTGLLRAPLCDTAEVVLIVDLGQQETERLPPMREKMIAGVPIPLVHGSGAPHFPAAVQQLLLRGFG